MSRRTKKREDGWYDINLVIDENVDEELKPLVIGEYVRHSLNKLGQLEDIEEELGIDLITFYKIYAYGFYYKYKDEILYGLGYDNEINVASHKITTRYTTLHFKDYGKTWALTKEELL